MTMSYNDWYESIQSIKLKPSAAAAKIDQCPGSGFRKPQDGEHHWILVSDLSPELCYYCNKMKEGE